VSHQLAQHEQVHPGRREICAVGVTQPVWPHADRSAAFPMGAEHLAHPGLCHRLTGRWAAQHDEALRGRAAARAFVAKVVGELNEEAAMNRNDAFSAALADNAHLAATDVNVSQPQRADLARS
jgi:mitochondrial fission protein ELM1